MKQELVRTKSKISSLKREMSSIQQLHLAQQQVQAQLSAPTIISSRQELEQHRSSHRPARQNHSSSQPQQPQPSSVFIYNTENVNPPAVPCQTQHLSTSSNDDSLSPPGVSANPSCAAQSTQTISRPSSATLTSFANSISSSTTGITSNDLQPPASVGRASLNTTSSSIHYESSASPSDEQLRLYLTETLQREKDSAV